MQNKASKRSKIHEMEGKKQMANVEKTAESPPEDQAKAKKRGRPPAGTDRIPRVESFYRHVRQIETDDWGKRAWITIYRLRPLIDRMRSGQPKKLGRFGQPIDDEWLKTNHGSGTYRLYLGYKAPAADEKEVDTIEVDIFDPAFPPNIPGEQFLNIPENADWEWCRPLLKKTGGEAAAATAPQTPMSSIVEVMQATNEIRKTAIEEMRQATPAQPATDPLVTALTIAKDFMSMRADNPMVEVMKDELTAMRTELAAQRKRSDDLLDKLSAKNNAPETKAEPAALLKEFFNGFKSLREEAAELFPSGGRSRMSPIMEFFQPVMPAVIDMLKPVAVALAQNSMQPNPPAQQRIQQPPGAPPQANPQDFTVFLDMLTPRMVRFMRDYDDSASEFASWLYDGWGETAQRAVDTIATMGGVPALVAWYKTSTHWPRLMAAGITEPQFTKFLEDVVAWQPEPDDEEEAPPTNATDRPVIDLEAEPAKAN